MEYVNKLACLVDEHTVEVCFFFAWALNLFLFKLTDIKNQKSTVTAKYIVIAVGGRPNIPENLVPYQKHIITSDDIFSLKSSPGKTLVVGASYIALVYIYYICPSFNSCFLICYVGMCWVPNSSWTTHYCHG